MRDPENCLSWLTIEPHLQQKIKKHNTKKPQQRSYTTKGNLSDTLELSTIIKLIKKRSRKTPIWKRRRATSYLLFMVDLFWFALNDNQLRSVSPTSVTTSRCPSIWTNAIRSQSLVVKLFISDQTDIAISTGTALTSLETSSNTDISA